MATRKPTTGSSKRPGAKKPSTAVTARHVEELKRAVLTAADELQGDRLLRDGSIVLRTDQ
jgi:hypothetical protein